jgi:hypothetical protein
VSFTRRKFLRAGATSAISLGFGIASVRLAFSQSQGDPHGPIVRRSTDIPLTAQKEAIFSFRTQTFQPYVGDYFTTPNARGEMISLKLVSLTTYIASSGALGLTKERAETESFSLLFKADTRLPLFVSIYKVSHDRLGEFDLFLTERKDEAGSFFYEAVINHIA